MALGVVFKPPPDRPWAIPHFAQKGLPFFFFFLVGHKTIYFLKVLTWTFVNFFDEKLDGGTISYFSHKRYAIYDTKWNT
jgi:hypothetical protein